MRIDLHNNEIGNMQINIGIYADTKWFNEETNILLNFFID